MPANYAFKEIVIIWFLSGITVLVKADFKYLKKKIKQILFTSAVVYNFFLGMPEGVLYPGFVSSRWYEM